MTSRESRPVTNLAGRGARLWAAMNEGRDLAPTHVVLLEEACRTADRLDRYDEMINDPVRPWLRVDLDETGTELTVVVDRLHSEARMQQGALKQMVAELRQALEGEAAGTPPAAVPQTPAGGGNVVGLRAAVLAKRANAAG